VFLFLFLDPVFSTLISIELSQLTTLRPSYPTNLYIEVNVHTSHIILEFLNDERSQEDSPLMWNIYKHILQHANVKMLRIQNHLGHIWYGVLFSLLL
jgi:hypothetical protein